MWAGVFTVPGLNSCPPPPLLVGNPDLSSKKMFHAWNASSNPHSSVFLETCMKEVAVRPPLPSLIRNFDTSEQNKIATARVRVYTYVHTGGTGAGLGERLFHWSLPRFTDDPILKPLAGRPPCRYRAAYVLEWFVDLNIFVKMRHSPKLWKGLSEENTEENTRRAVGFAG